MSKYTGVKEDELLQWQTYRFYNKYIMLSHKAQTEERHQELLKV